MFKLLLYNIDINQSILNIYCPVCVDIRLTEATFRNGHVWGPLTKDVLDHDYDVVNICGVVIVHVSASTLTVLKLHFVLDPQWLTDGILRSA